MKFKLTQMKVTLKCPELTVDLACDNLLHLSWREKDKSMPRRWKGGSADRSNLASQMTGWHHPLLSNLTLLICLYSFKYVIQVVMQGYRFLFHVPFSNTQNGSLRSPKQKLKSPKLPAAVLGEIPHFSHALHFCHSWYPATQQSEHR